MLKLLGKPTSINVRKVLWLAAELDLALAHDAMDGPGDADALRALNPNGLVPVLIDGSAVLWESNTVCRYLAARQRRHDLLPAEPLARARVEQWMDWQATELNGAWRPAFMALVRRTPLTQDASAVEASISAWNRLMGLLDAQLATTGAFVAGADFTLADIVLGLSANRWRMTPMARPVLPAVDAWIARLETRAGYRAHGGNGIP
ncbi:glutathione S-transferase N-terminal domain-containing protein [Pseudoxanthomonas winnipegensis]|uniref:glutathione S-transferase N-terminal domain-containing protein n=1 Tax=Pseudoxanthomonas winnipegensis TaxID=2480810 RepID=UPI0025753B94|nr:glutathione S-transferase N-terminal domain-containing protein [Pseudoxanthomonas winnipegensis]WJI15800.1 glutathione S-transferase N-terminal domain-containing protein [Pseudoxanthomonas winnipegensis]